MCQLNGYIIEQSTPNIITMTVNNMCIVFTIASMFRLQDSG